MSDVTDWYYPLEPLSGMEGAVMVACATSRRSGRDRWTTLALWYAPNRKRFPYVVEVEGGTTVPGEEQRLRRRVYATLALAVAFFEPGQLRDEVEAQVMAYLNAGGIADTAVTLQRLLATGREQRS